MAVGGRQLSYLPLHSICQYDWHNTMYSNGLHSSSHVVDSTTSELAVMSYMRISMLLFVGVIFRGSFGCNSSLVSTESIYSVSCRRGMIMLVFWVDSEIDVLTTVFYLSLCDTYRAYI